MEQKQELEIEFDKLELDVSWSVFGNARMSDVDDLLTTNDIHGAKRLQVVDMWKRHPKNKPCK